MLKSLAKWVFILGAVGALVYFATEGVYWPAYVMIGIGAVFGAALNIRAAKMQIARDKQARLAPPD